MRQLTTAQQIYASIGGTAFKAIFGTTRGWGWDMRNPHTRKAGPGRKGVHVQGPSLRSRTTPRRRPYSDHANMFNYHAFVEGE